MITSEAAKAIGISVSQLRNLIRQGKVNATKKKSFKNQYYYEISDEEIERAKGLYGYDGSGQSVGYPRGRKRSS